MNKWSLVDGEMMREIFEAYKNEPSLSKEVLEIQLLDQLALRPTNIRVFISSGFSIENDYPEYNKLIREAIAVIKTQIPTLSDTRPIMCMWEDGPRLSPMPSDLNGGPATVTNMTLFGRSFFTEEEIVDILEVSKNISGTLKKSIAEFKNTKMKFWMYPIKQNNGTYVYVSPSSKGVPANVQPMYRIRSLNLEEWRTYTDRYIKNDYIAPEEITKEDISVNDIIY